MDRATFRIVFPEFAKTADARVDAFLGMAILECSEEAYGAQFATAVGYLAAHLIAQSPYGQNARSSDASTGRTTIYQEHFERLQTMAGLGPRVI